MKRSLSKSGVSKGRYWTVLDGFDRPTIVTFPRVRFLRGTIENILIISKQATIQDDRPRKTPRGRSTWKC